MVQVIDILLPILTLVIAALLTIPVFRLIRKSSNPTTLTVGWFVAVFAVAGATVANLALSYYSVSSPGLINIGLNGAVSTNPNGAFSSAFLIDAISIFMAVIIVGLSAVVVLYSVFSIGNNERPSERYFAIMLMTTAGLLGAVLAGDLLT